MRTEVARAGPPYELAARKEGLASSVPHRMAPATWCINERQDLHSELEKDEEQVFAVKDSEHRPMAQSKTAGSNSVRGKQTCRIDEP